MFANIDVAAETLHAAEYATLPRLTRSAIMARDGAGRASYTQLAITPAHDAGATIRWRRGLLRPLLRAIYAEKPGHII